MSIDYFDQLEDFVPQIEAGATVEAIHASINESFALIDVTPTLLSAEQWDDAPPFVLFGYSYDTDMTLYLYAIPEDKLSPELRNAMEKANYYAWAYDELMLGDEDGQAYLRLDAAFGQDEWEAILEDIPDEVDDFEIDIAETDRDCLSQYQIGKLEHGEEPQLEDNALAKRFVASYMGRRCQ